jgi:hypothetical protein
MSYFVEIANTEHHSAALNETADPGELPTKSEYQNEGFR